MKHIQSEVTIEPLITYPIELSGSESQLTIADIRPRSLFHPQSDGGMADNVASQIAPYVQLHTLMADTRAERVAHDLTGSYANSVAYIKNEETGGFSILAFAALHRVDPRWKQGPQQHEFRQFGVTERSDLREMAEDTADGIDIGTPRLLACAGLMRTLCRRLPENALVSVRRHVDDTRRGSFFIAAGFRPEDAKQEPIDAWKARKELSIGAKAVCESLEANPAYAFLKPKHNLIQKPVRGSVPQVGLFIPHRG